MWPDSDCVVVHSALILNFSVWSTKYTNLIRVDYFLILACVNLNCEEAV